MEQKRGFIVFFFNNKFTLNIISYPIIFEVLKKNLDKTKFCLRVIIICFLDLQDVTISGVMYL